MSAKTRARRAIKKKGAVATFTVTTGDAYDPVTDTFTPGGSESIEVPAIETDADADRFAALGLVLTNPVTLLIAAEHLTFAPAPGMTFAWAGADYVVRDVEPRSLDGSPLMYRITGGR